jgi:NAD(P)-dependent dehydrogenase (short-subunit alcohol dehydrogenase family)
VNYYAENESDADGLPPRLDDVVLDINLRSVVWTAHLALHFFRKNQDKPGGSLVVTASTGGLYATPLLPMYAAAKFGCVGLVRSLAVYLEGTGIRVNCVCPGAVATGLLKKEEWAKFPQDTMTPVENVAKAVAKLVEDESLTGKSLMVVQDRLTIIDNPEPSDPALLGMMSKNNVFKEGM